MSKKMTLVLVGLFMAFGLLASPIAMNERPSPNVDFTKAEYYAAIEAYENGLATKHQDAILEATGYFREASAIDYAGGPDPYGYMFRDSSEPDGPAYQWVDIVPGGSQVFLADESNSGELPLGFTFNFYGVPQDFFFIHDNGAINFTGGWVPWYSSAIPTTDLLDVIAPFWIDLDPSIGGEIYYWADFVDDRMAMVVSYINVPIYGDPATTVTFQTILFEDDTIVFNYDWSDPVTYISESVGIQATNDGVTGLFISYIDDPVSYPYDTLAIEIYLDGGPDPVILNGWVYDNDTQLPLENALIQLNGGAYYTDADGYYEVTEGLSPGNFPTFASLYDYYRQYQVLNLGAGVNTVDWYLVPCPPPITDPYFDNFETGPGVFVASGAVWMHGIPTIEPAGAYSEDYCWDTVIDGDYPNDAWAWLKSTERFQVPMTGDFECSYYHWYDIEANYDGYVMAVGTDGWYYYAVNPVGGYPGSSMDFDDCYSGNSGGWQQATFDLTAWAGQAVFITFIFGSDITVTNPGVAIDDFFIGSPTPPPPVEFTIEPVGETLIPSNGGTLVYNAYLMNNTANMWSNLLYWTEVMLPNGNMYGPIIDVPFSILPHMEVWAPDQTLTIPPGAPAGDYMFYASVGRRPGPQLTSNFPFSKTQVRPGPEGGSNEWSGSIPTFVLVGEDVTVAAGELPAEFEMAPVYPNPFNPTANLSIALPEAAELKVAVFNVMGQQVAELANGQFNAGVQTFTIDGSNLASGIYFVRATVPGHLDQVQKVLIVS